MLLAGGNGGIKAAAPGHVRKRRCRRIVHLTQRPHEERRNLLAVNGAIGRESSGAG